MDESPVGTPFYAAFGEFKDGYNREEAEAGIHEAFRLRQRARQKTYVKELMLGSGLGKAAKRTVQSGLYQPQTALYLPTNVVSAAAAVADAGDVSEECEESGDADEDPIGKFLMPPGLALLSNSPSSVMNKFTRTEVEVQTLVEVERQLEENIKVAEESVARECASFSFENLLESLSLALAVVEEGDAQIQVKLPVQQEDAVPLHGAEAVMAYFREHMAPITLTLLATLYATEWMLQYTMTFINSMFIENEKEAQLREELLARCVRWLGKINRFVAFAFALEMASESYEAFAEMHSLAEQHTEELLNGIEGDINSALLLSFPKRRQGLLGRDGRIKKRLQQLLQLLHDVETSWLPTVKLQRDWKDEFLTRMYSRIHTVIAPGYLSAQLGFIDESLYEFVVDGTVLQKQNAMNVTRSSNGQHTSFRQSLPRILVATQVERRIVDEKLTFQQIGMLVRGSASRVIGLQLCMGTRFILRQCDTEYDAQWGFSMSHSQDSPNAVRDAVESVSCFMESLKMQLKEQMDYQMGMLRHFLI
ncbi:hypothetical protein C4B63_7g271 [Trypanosoma cruzi]|uniref:Uncharacterized protein n=1 Tax=Trypanosoma cruzi TaxID=5693 RepID=A0A2V2VUX6_TRYCR|nr:hypothetical protein C4B63_7g271 [Trypanosoma cruzi]